MFDRESRYADTPPFTSQLARGTRPRAVETLPGIVEHRLTRQDRLDRLAAQYYGDPRKWWLILDANPSIVCGSDLDLGYHDGSVIVIPSDTGQGRR